MSEKESEKQSGVGVYVIGAVVLLAGIGGIVWLSGGDDKKAPPEPVATVTEEPVNYAPPPPPPPKKKTAEPEDAGPEDAGDDGGDAAPVASGTGKPSGVGGAGPCSKCGEGEGNSALTSAIQGAAGSARGCYNRAINKGGSAAEGKMNVAVNVGSSGAVCSASITKDTVGSPDVSSCVLKQFQGKSFPKPTSGCVTVNVPLSFAVKKD
ncbi:MAG: AgmX/PglI C-terminal domain-containing protein [Polyangiaceae bacterium]|nr:AgmX/PglI C-terminal domain-containing protein [Polyangiaceae bacterium]MBK8940445.1 AgmX/PglI C-terminal domain-containing protein [Polyangiaceae bacterium]